MPVTNHAITVFIDGVNKTSALLKDALYINLTTRNNGSSAEFIMKNFRPLGREPVEIKVNGTTIFGGFIRTVNAEVVGVGATSVTKYHCECVDWLSALEQIDITDTFIGASDTDVIDGIFAYSTAITFDTSTNVDSLDSDLDIAFSQMTLRQALDELAKTVGADWFISPDKKLYWYSPDAPSHAAFDIDTVSPNNTTTFSILRNSLNFNKDVNTIINQVQIIGGSYASDTKQTQTFTASGKSYTGLNYPAITPFSIVYTDISDVQHTVWGSQIGHEPVDKIASEGGYVNAVITEDLRGFKIEDENGVAPKTGTNVVIQYYYKQEVNITVDDIESQSVFGIFPTIVKDGTYVNDDHAIKVAQAILDENAWGQEAISFNTTKYGLLPGTFINLNIPEIGVGASAIKSIVQQDYDDVLLENEDDVLLEVYGEEQGYVIKEVKIQPLVTDTNEFMLVSSITVGRAAITIIDNVAALEQLEIVKTPTTISSKLSNYSSNLGDIVMGKATFTDGGSARFDWGSPNGATGLVVGLDDSGPEVYGAAEIYQSGTLKAKIGRLNNLANLGTVEPSGWGIYTTNGYFSGVVYASELIGGTITGNYISGSFIYSGTINAAVLDAAEITSSYIHGNSIIGGTIATSEPPINSSNPGVHMDATGLYGYGSAGLTFRLSSDPAIKPYFSSGTIEHVTYEVTTQSVIRTGTTNPKVQIDNSGIFAYNSAGALKFSVDSATGILTATDGIFSGSVTASTISGGTITGALVTAGTVSGVTVTANNITGGTITGSRITGGTITGVAVTANNISGGTITGVTVTANNISGGTITGARITAGTITGVAITANTFTSGTITSSSISAATISGGTITGVTITANNISGGTISSPRIIGTADLDTLVVYNNIQMSGGGTIWGTAYRTASGTGNIYIGNIGKTWMIESITGWLVPTHTAAGDRQIGQNHPGSALSGLWMRDNTNGSAYHLIINNGTVWVVGPTA